MDSVRRWLDVLDSQGLVLSEGQCELLIRLDSMVVKWNQAVGLTGFQNAEERFDRYFGEALHASKWLPEQGSVVDVGSGGGSPALPMAIHRPGLEWTFLEPNFKKTVFLQEACATLGLENIKVVQSRFQEFDAGSPVAAITTRGLALGKDALRVFRQWLQPSGKLLILTGEKAGQKIVDGEMSGWTIQAKKVLAPRFQSVLVVLGREEECALGEIS
jgi:16S rRNA (guanine527-N7)-methyltransferase